ncbi:MAG: hypothetical protein JRI47_09390 [Deltaproteobacteria bacterium]|nr:hypothetical protein [Deltaproteobacteria bacterium]
MRQYRIDELRVADYEKIKSHMDDSFGPSALGGLYWVPVEDNLLDEIQIAHADCQPFYFAVELQEDCISFELLIRTKERIRCDCIQYANLEQRESIIRFADHLFETLKIVT